MPETHNFRYRLIFFFTILNNNIDCRFSQREIIRYIDVNIRFADLSTVLVGSVSDRPVVDGERVDEHRKQLALRADTQLGIDVAPMDPYRARGDIEDASDGVGLMALEGIFDHLPFARGQNIFAEFEERALKADRSLALIIRIGLAFKPG